MMTIDEFSFPILKHTYMHIGRYGYDFMNYHNFMRRRRVSADCSDILTIRRNTGICLFQYLGLFEIIKTW